MTGGGKIWQTLWRLAVCGLLMFWIFHAIFTKEGKLEVQRRGGHWEQLSRAQQWQTAWTAGPRELWHNLRRVDPAAFAGSVALVGITVVIGFVRWRMVLGVHGLRLSLTRAAEISLVAQFFNSFLLGSTGGDLIKAYYAARETNHKKTEAVVTVFVDRLIGLWAMLLFAVLMMPLNWSLLAEHERLRATSSAIIAMASACSVLAILAFWGGVSKRFPTARNFFRRLPKGEWLERSLDSCREFGRHKSFLLRALVLTLILNVVCVAQGIVLARGLHLQIPFTAMFVIVPTIICISALPITPSGLGVRENLFVLMLAVPEINVSETAALSLSLLTFAGSLFWSLVGGLVYLTFKDKHHLSEVAAENPAADTP